MRRHEKAKSSILSGLMTRGESLLFWSQKLPVRKLYNKWYETRRLSSDMSNERKGTLSSRTLVRRKRRKRLWKLAPKHLLSRTLQRHRTSRHQPNITRNDARPSSQACHDGSSSCLRCMARGTRDPARGTLSSSPQKRIKVSWLRSLRSMSTLHKYQSMRRRRSVKRRRRQQNRGPNEDELYRERCEYVKHVSIDSEESWKEFGNRKTLKIKVFKKSIMSMLIMCTTHHTRNVEPSRTSLLRSWTPSSECSTTD